MEVLDEHLNSLIVLRTEGNNNIGVLHRRLDKIIIGWLDEAVVLGKHINDCATSVSDVSLNCKYT